MFCHTSKACFKKIFLSRTTGEFEVPEKKNIYPIGSLYGFVCLQLVDFYGKLIGKNTSPMHPLRYGSVYFFGHFQAET